MNPKDEANLELAIDKLNRVIRVLGEQSSYLEHRLATLYRYFFVSFSILVISHHERRPHTRRHGLPLQ